MKAKSIRSLVILSFLFLTSYQVEYEGKGDDFSGERAYYPGCEKKKVKNRRWKCTCRKVIKYLKKEVVVPDYIRTANLPSQWMNLIYVEIDFDGSINDACLIYPPYLTKNNLNYKVIMRTIKAVKALPQFTPALNSKGDTIPFSIILRI